MKKWLAPVCLGVVLMGPLTVAAQQEGDDVVRDAFMSSCVTEGKKAIADSKEKIDIDFDLYCACTWNKIIAKGLSLDKLTELQDQNSPLFMEVVAPCLQQAMGLGSEEEEGEEEQPVSATADVEGGGATETLPITRLSQTDRVKVVIAGVEKYFILDTGAEDMFISADFERELLLEGGIKKADYLGTYTYKMANGQNVKCRRVKLASIQLGPYTVKNVTVAVSDEKNALLLLGKSVLNKFSHWTINNKKGELVLTR